MMKASYRIGILVFCVLLLLTAKQIERQRLTRSHEQEKDVYIGGDGMSLLFDSDEIAGGLFFDSDGYFTTSDVTLMGWIYPTTADSNDDSTILLVQGDLGTSADLRQQVTSDGYFMRFSSAWTVATGAWVPNTTDNISLNAWHHVAVTYSWSSTDNDPVLYLDGAVYPTTESNAPDGTHENLMAQFIIGPIKTQAENWKVYSRILTSDEIYQEYASRLVVGPDERDLEFHIDGMGVTGLSTFDGQSFTSDNNIIDRINGITTTFGMGDGTAHDSVNLTYGGK